MEYIIQSINGSMILKRKFGDVMNEVDNILDYIQPMLKML